MVTEKNAKERILNASIELFSKYGFDATGIRKIAQKAEVNLSMINYYFKTKEGILLELLDIFFINIESQFIKADLLSLDIEERFYEVFKILTNIIRSNQDLFKIIIYTNSADKVEFNLIKMQKLRKVIYFIYGKDAIEKHLENRNSDLKLNMIGPGLIGLVFSNFLLKDLIQKLSLTELNDDFYEEYPKFMSKLFLYGIKDDFDKYL